MDNVRLFIGQVEQPVKFLKFPAGEIHVEILSEDKNKFKSCLIRSEIRSGDDLMKTLLLTDAIRNKWGNATEISLLMSYVPYGRQDRYFPNGAFSLRVFCEIINAQNYATVYVHDAHSFVTLGLLKNCKGTPQAEILKTYWKFIQRDIPEASEGIFLCSPDAGAEKKVEEALGLEDVVRLLTASKKREILSGKVIGCIIHDSEHDLYQKEGAILIVDDICDGGRTFIELTKELKKRTSLPIYLYVTHGIFSKGVYPLIEAGIKRIFVAYPFAENLSDEYVTDLSKIK